MEVTKDTPQLSNGWLKADAPSNMLPMEVTEDTSQLSNGWLKADAL
eukprot:CAMPEP_0118705646 /NCGR_PEP_ID=MMETSP0800-20121206/19991_1 /TAXON_ID=210618 ORGANISM="Striatella unipunctata, Strain CCMP2910" /NCGR_SAMPLE_ID=MMETSP0800 /ASSEMBLY_ACC=CAM_ASM_000638 /LENGTH=45 /DNA_ID= /DNA_START= /DNA_END= /DNA_ORIENTATION=